MKIKDVGLESSSHIIIHCTFAWRFWSLILHNSNVRWVSSLSTADFFVQWVSLSSGKFRDLWKLIWYFGAWNLWKVRNKRVFQHEETEIYSLLFSTTCRAVEFYKFQHHDFPYSENDPFNIKVIKFATVKKKKIIFFPEKIVKKMQVDIISRELIKPSSPIILQTKKPFKFALFNQLTPITYTPFIFFYPTTSSSSPNNVAQTLVHLKETLSQTLDLYYPFSGRVVDNSHIDHFDEGIPLIIARINGLVLSEFLKNPRLELMNEFVPFKPYTKVTDMGVPQMGFQVSVFSCGGIAIGCSASHKLIDAPTGAAFLHAWSTLTRTGSLSSVVKPNCDEASVYFPPKNPFPQEHLALMETLWFTEGNYVSKRFVFNANAIATLRIKARGEGNEKKRPPSRIEALSCFIWKCCMTVSSKAISGAPKLSVLVEAVNLRTRTKPPMSNVSIGDIFWWATAMADPSFLEKELHDLAALLDESIGLYDDREYMDSLQGDDGFETMAEYCNQLQELISVEKPDIFAFTSWCHLGINKMDFGFGNPFWFGILGKVGPAFRNLTVFTEARDGKGIEAWITLDEERMTKLERDPEFLAYACPNPTISSM
ncbi:stemmadenine O-acetyltransferase-like [Mercurialis annua]|uniref:stemmadenine O-acetyltransferase-like n=1 Tax=Mercurialis annua TaxID=3986 RepID=UPI002160306F|nr:stemmadenine O-acetyltransferase-like [Mercurialis annua]